MILHNRTSSQKTTHLQSPHPSDRKPLNTIQNQVTEPEIMHINLDLCEFYGNITSVQQHIHELKKELALQKQLAELKKQAH